MRKKQLSLCVPKQYVVYFSMLVAMLFLNVRASATFISSGAASCKLVAISTNNPLGPSMINNPNGPGIYDDGYSNFYDGSNGNWNCGRTALFVEYTNEPVTFEFTYGGMYSSPSTYPVTSHDIKVYRNGIWVNTFSDIPDLNGDGSHHLFTLLATYTALAGEYTIEYWRNDGGIKTHPDIIGTFVIQRKIQKMWLEMDPICVTYNSPEYHFQLHSYPEFADIMVYSHDFKHSSGCSDLASINFLDFDFQSDVTIKHGYWPTLLTSGPSSFGNRISGALWDPVTASVTNINDMWMDNVNSSNPVDLAYYRANGTAPVIKIIVSDAISTYTVQASMIIKSPALPDPGPLNAYAPDFFPPQATGQPAASYDFYDYTVTGSELWTPTNNPTVKMRGGGGTVNTIRIQHNLTITEEAMLDLETGMKLEFGPGATVTVKQSSTGTTQGGFLTMGSTTFTAYRGCNDDEQSTWGGVSLGSTHLWPQGTNWFATPQAKIWMNFSTISYADVGLQTGDNGSDGGGLIRAVNGNTFLNNKTHVILWKYANMAGPGGTEIGSILSFHATKFENNTDVWFPCSAFVSLNGVRGVGFSGCSFINNTGTEITAAIVTANAQLGVNNSNFENFKSGILDLSFFGSGSLNLTGNTFTNNNYGIYLTGAAVPKITFNTFNIPDFKGTDPTTHLPGTNVFELNDQSAGVIVSGMTGYTISGNTFKTTAPSSLPGYYKFTTGTIQHNTGSDNNLVSSNTFKGLGVAMMSNFKNNNVTAGTGLQYWCNTNTYTQYDISIAGVLTADGGINPVQATPGSAPAGNKFWAGVNIDNNQQHINYNYNNGVTDEKPMNYSLGFVTPISVSAAANCSADLSGLPPYSVSVLGNNSKNTVLLYHLASANLNYYLSDKRGADRELAYYWAGEMHTANADLLITNMLIEDSLVDSAIHVYDNILSKYSLDSVETNDFIVGRTLISMLINKRAGEYNMLTLDSAQADSLEYVKGHTSMWAFNRARNWLFIAGKGMLSHTLLYPDGSSDEVVPGPPGVLAVTEISNGPAHDCEYVEMVVANCGSNTASAVNIEGWIIDDNASNFNVGGCNIGDLSTSIGHYRLTCAPLWENVPVGSIIVMYNRDKNCYSLPDNVRIDTTETGLVYWMPIGGTALNPEGPAYIERQISTPNLLSSSYLSDHKIQYNKASGWATTIGLNMFGDAIQVRCPSCDYVDNGNPAFYHGIGYGPASGIYSFAPITAGENDLGGVVKHCFGAASKFVFNGSSLSEFNNAEVWSKAAADNVGSTPVTLGNINSELKTAIIEHTLSLPCCGGSVPGRGETHPPVTPAVIEVQDISVYPNPANNMLYFQFPAGKATVRLFDVSGRVMNEQEVTNGTNATVNVKDYAPGIYLYQVVTDSKTESGKIMIGK